jgi:hypothetical protein
MKNSVHSWVRTSKDIRDLGARGLSDCLEASWRDSETAREIVQDWLNPDEGGPGFQLLTEVEISAAIVFLFIFISTPFIIKLSIYSFYKVFSVL